VLAVAVATRIAAELRRPGLHHHQRSTAVNTTSSGGSNGIITIIIIIIIQPASQPTSGQQID